MLEIMELHNSIIYQHHVAVLEANRLSRKYKGQVTSYPYGKFKGRPSAIKGFTVGDGDGLLVLLAPLHKRTGEYLNNEASRTYIPLNDIDISEIKECLQQKMY